MVETNDVVIVENASTVGQRLREAREAKKITIAEVAAQLRLTKGAITYLETDQWEQLYGRAYARGYFANYVKFLSLPQDELLSAFNLEYKISEPEIRAHQLPPQKKSRLVPFLFIITILVLTWFAYQQWQVVKDNNIEAIDKMELDDGFSSSVVEPLFEKIGLKSTNTEKETPVNSKEQPLEAIKEVTSEPQSQLEIANETVTDEIKIDNVVVTEATIELQFSEDSWVEVTDANGHLLTKKIGKAGKRITLSGLAPIAVLLGNATAVTVKYNGNTIDITNYIKNDVARFGLGVTE